MARRPCRSLLVLLVLLVLDVLPPLAQLALLANGKVADKVERLGQRELPHLAHLVRVFHALDHPSHFDELGPERGGDELRARVRLSANHGRDGGAVLRIQSRVDLVKEVKGHRVAPLDGEDEGDGDDGLLAAGELLHLHRLALPERHLDLDAAVLLRETLSRRRRLLGSSVGGCTGVGVLGVGSGQRLLALHHELALAAVHQPREHLAEIEGNLLERSLDGLVLLLVQEGHQLLDLGVRLVELAPASLQALALLGELLVLVQSLFVHVR
mmetsp:Transcript_4217/g.17377  ORF Transcript_4217/g.17377 Transcript_4217/m.17377 type:complete len:269 (-) Transcript_4217:340-1146(-)